MQDYLTIGWLNKFPILQSITPCALAARVLSSVLGSRVSDYVYIDFASGSGGPTPYFEKQLNNQLCDEGKDEVKFVLSDISPHIQAWSAAAKRSDNLSYIATSVDATNAPPTEVMLKGIPNIQGKKIMRLFSLAFHHFDDELAEKVLQNTIETSDGFCIFELQSRNFSSFITVSLLWPLAMLCTPFYFLHSPGHLFFTYLVPLVPFVWVFDGYISCLRTRQPEEILALMRERVPEYELDKWDFKSGAECHMWPFGWFYWIIATKRS